MSAELLGAFEAAGALSASDAAMAQVLAQIAGGCPPESVLATALCLRGARLGHVCVDLAQVRRTVRLELDSALPWPDPSTWTALTECSALAAGGGRTPLVVDGGRVYLDRYFQDEVRVAAELLGRATREAPAVDAARLGAGVRRLFELTRPGSAAQALAATVGVIRRLAVITGGPGTGKTTTLVKLLALAIEQRPELRVVMLAPTGKAADRMRGSVIAQRDQLLASGQITAAVADRLPQDAQTLHRALKLGGPHGSSSADPLAADLVVVDEASMVDLAMMARLLDAVPSAATLVLVGDRHQLASVEAGVVLGDICEAAKGASEAFMAELAAIEPALPGALSPGVGGLGDCVVELTHRFRFASEGGIGGVADAVNRGDGAGAIARLRVSADAVLVDGTPDQRRAALRSIVVSRYAAAARQAGATNALAAQGRFRVLCAHRRGRFGASGLNTAFERWLADSGLPVEVGGRWPGQPILVTRNDYGVRLFNGDVGVVLAGEDGRLSGWFRDGAGVRSVPLGRLPPHDAALALTVHKSQGSEYEEVVVVLPERRSRVLTRELLYTAITRARQRVTLVGSAEVLAAGVAERVVRASGLAERLRGSE